MIKRVVDVVELVALACVAATVVLLFANDPDDGVALDGAAIYDDSCAGCHGDDGGGGFGPQLAGGAAVAAFPDPADQIAVVTEGRGGRMPSFGDRLTAEEIAAVVEYTRTGLG